MAIDRYVKEETRILGRYESRKKGSEVYRSVRPTIVPESVDDITITADAGTRLDLLASKFYGSPSLWFVIAAVNNFTNGSMHVPPGTQIRIPAKFRVL